MIDTPAGGNQDRKRKTMRARRTKAQSKASPTASKAAESRAVKARAILRRVIDEACIARGEAQWTNGYRAGRMGAETAAEDTRLYQKEITQFRFCAIVEKKAERAMAAYALAVRRASR